VRNGWWGGSGGFKVVYFDPGAMRRQLDELVENRAGNKVCRDQLVGSLEHQLGSSMRGMARALVGQRAGAHEGRDADTWREVDRPGAEGLHFCVSREDMKAPGPGGPSRHVRLDDIHLDWRSPVKGINREGMCEYTGVISGLRHWAQARFQTERPLFVFHDTDRCIQDLFTATGPLPPGLAAERDTLREEWESHRLSLAVQGTPGLAGANAFHARATALSRRLPRR
jgi:hypothetical protein